MLYVDWLMLRRASRVEPALFVAVTDVVVVVVLAVAVIAAVITRAPRVPVLGCRRHRRVHAPIVVAATVAASRRAFTLSEDRLMSRRASSVEPDLLVAAMAIVVVVVRVSCVVVELGAVVVVDLLAPAVAVVVPAVVWVSRFSPAHVWFYSWMLVHPPFMAWRRDIEGRVGRHQRRLAIWNSPVPEQSTPIWLWDGVLNISPQQAVWARQRAGVVVYPFHGHKHTELGSPLPGLRRVVDMDTLEFFALVVTTSQRRLGILLGLAVQAQRSLVSSGLSMLVSMHSSEQVRPTIRSTSSGFQA